MIQEKNGTTKSIGKNQARISGNRNLGTSAAHVGALLAHDAAPAGIAPREQLRTLLQAVKAARQGNFSVRIPVNQEGILGEIGEVLNDIFELNENMSTELTRVAKIVGQEG